MDDSSSSPAATAAATMFLGDPVHDALLAQDNIQAYLEALEKCPQVIRDESPHAMFLAFCKHDVNQAASRLASYWNLRKEIFTNVAFQPILQALTEKEKAVIAEGIGVVLPHEALNDDKFVFFSDRSRIVTRSSTETRLKWQWFLMQSMSLEMFQHGTTFNAVYLTLLNTQAQAALKYSNANPSPQDLRKRIIEEALCVRFVGVHGVALLQNDASSKRLFTETVVPVSVEAIRQVLCNDDAAAPAKLHLKESVEQVLKSLEAHGFCAQYLPTCVGGAWSYETDWPAWLQRKGILLNKKPQPPPQPQALPNASAALAPPRPTTFASSMFPTPQAAAAARSNPISAPPPPAPLPRPIPRVMMNPFLLAPPRPIPRVPPPPPPPGLMLRPPPPPPPPPGGGGGGGAPPLLLLGDHLPLPVRRGGGRGGGKQQPPPLGLSGLGLLRSLPPAAVLQPFLPAAAAAERHDHHPVHQAIMASSLHDDSAAAAAYTQALNRCPEIVKTDSPYEQFLAFCQGNVNAAAKRLTSYWTLRKQVFGETDAFLPLSQALAMLDVSLLVRGDLGAIIAAPAAAAGQQQQEQQPILYLHGGGGGGGGGGGAAGGEMIHSKPSSSSSGTSAAGSHHPQLRVMWYMLQSIADLAGKRKSGSTMEAICICRLSPMTLAVFTDEIAESISNMIRDAMCVRFQLHVVVVPPPETSSSRSSSSNQFEQVIPLALEFLGEMMNCGNGHGQGTNTILHHNTTMVQVLSSLQAHLKNIPIDLIPRSCGGSWDLETNWRSWLQNHSSLRGPLALVLMMIKPTKPAPGKRKLDTSSSSLQRHGFLSHHHQ